MFSCFLVSLMIFSIILKLFLIISQFFIFFIFACENRCLFCVAPVYIYLFFFLQRKDARILFGMFRETTARQVLCQVRREVHLHSFFRSFVCPSVRSFVCSFIHTLVRSFIQTFVRFFIHLFLQPINQSVSHLFICLLIHSFIHLSINDVSPFSPSPPHSIIFFISIVYLYIHRVFIPRHTSRVFMAPNTFGF